MAHNNAQACKARIMVESVFISRFAIYIVLKLQKCWTHKIAFKIISKMLKQPNLFHSQPPTVPMEALAKFYLSTAFGLSFMISSVAPIPGPIRSSTFYIYLITKIGNRNSNVGTQSNKSLYKILLAFNDSSHAV